MPSESADGNNTAMSDFCAEFDIEKDLFLFLFFFFCGKQQCKTALAPVKQAVNLGTRHNHGGRRS